MLDYDGDGWMDLFVANDTEPNRLYRNRGNGTFEDVAVGAGVAFSEQGVARAGMGVDAADYDGSGRPSLIIGNFSNEMMALYHNEGKGLFIDDAPRLGDRQGDAADADVRLFLLRLRSRRPARYLQRQRPRQRRHRESAVARHVCPARLISSATSTGNSSRTCARQAGTAFARAVVARGAAYADYDNDGDLDVLMNVNNGPARLLRNDGGNRSNVIRIRTIGDVIESRRHRRPRRRHGAPAGTARGRS